MLIFVVRSKRGKVLGRVAVHLTAVGYTIGELIPQ